MTTVLLGNTAPNRLDAAGAVVPADIGNTITTFYLRDDYEEDAVVRSLQTANDPVLDLMAQVVPASEHRYLHALAELNDAWATLHSNDPPEWVESDDPAFATVVAHWFSSDSFDAAKGVDVIGLMTQPQTALALSAWVGARDHECLVGRPDGWTSAADVPPLGGGAIDHEHTDGWQWSEDAWCWFRQAELLVNAGRDSLHDQHFKTTAQPVGFGWMGLSANTAAEVATNTTLPGEITTAGGGLIRGVATYAHTASTNLSTMTRLFTANGSDALSVVIAKDGLFNAITAGTFGYEKLLNATATLTVSGDNITVTHSITAG